MRPFTTLAIIAISLLLTTSCKTQSSAPAQSPAAADAAPTADDSQQNQDSPEIDEQQSQSQVDDSEECKLKTMINHEEIHGLLQAAMK